MKKVRLREGLEIAYSDMGKGEKTLLFIHGLASNRKAWRKNIPELSRDFRCIALDLPGYGASSPGPFKGGLDFLAGCIAEFCRRLELNRICLVGHSMGGQLAMTLTLSELLPLKELVLIAPAGFETFAPNEQAWLARFFSADLLYHLPDFQVVKNFESNFYKMPDDARFMIEDRRKLSRDPQRFRLYCETVSANLQAMLDGPVFPNLKKITQPTLIFFGEEDKLIPNRLLHPRLKVRQVGEKGAGAIPNSRFLFLPKCGHFLQWECGSLFNFWVKEFLK